MLCVLFGFVFSVGVFYLRKKNQSQKPRLFTRIDFLYNKKGIFYVIKCQLWWLCISLCKMQHAWWLRHNCAFGTMACVNCVAFCDAKWPCQNAFWHGNYWRFAQMWQSHHCLAKMYFCIRPKWLPPCFQTFLHFKLSHQIYLAVRLPIRT